MICGRRDEDEMSEGRGMRFPSYIRIRTPEKLPDAIALVADRKMTTRSDYVRRAVIEKLKADGLDIEELSAA
jgi:hypothetical protein